LTNVQKPDAYETLTELLQAEGKTVTCLPHLEIENTRTYKILQENLNEVSSAWPI
jgi:hypothetical protein